MAVLTFLFTDIEGSTPLLRRTGADTNRQIFADHDAVIRSALAGHDGTELNFLGDGFFAELRGNLGPEQCDRAYNAGLSLSYADALEAVIGAVAAPPADPGSERPQRGLSLAL